jgi:hypothetical protein
MSPGVHPSGVQRIPFSSLRKFVAIGCTVLLLAASPVHAGNLNLAWDPPTANLDGTQLTDLSLYRVYFATGSPACGGSSFKEVASPIPNPVPGDTVTASLTGLVAGATYSVQVSAVDASGNESLCSNEATGLAKADLPDTTPPTGSLTLNEGASYTRWTAATLDLAASDAVGVTGYYASTSSATPPATASGWGAISPTTSYGAREPYTLTSGDGSKAVYAWFKDAAGNVSNTASASIILDQTSPSNGTLSATAGAGQVALTWSGVSDGGSGLASSNPYKLVYSTGSYPSATCTDGTQLALGSSTSFTHTGLTNGSTYYYRLCAADKAGNVAPGATALATAGSPDTTRPSVTITSPTSNSAYSTASGSLTLAGTASDNSAVASVTWANNQGGAGTASGTTNWTASGISLQPGKNVLTVTAQDAAGNTQTDTLTVTYTPPDTTPPMLAITAPTSSSTYATTSSSLALSGTASDNVGVKSVTWANDRGGSGTASGTTRWKINRVNLQSGTNVLTVTAQDAGRNTTTATLTVTYTVPVSKR